MNTENWHRMAELLEETLQQPASERENWLRNACGDATELFDEVWSLCQSAERSEGYFTGWEAEMGRVWEEDQGGQLTGTLLGPYLVGEKIGQGGMAVVYQASRVDGQYEEEVAIKVLKKGLDSAAILQRFRYEQQLLAELRHPNIANLLDAGETPTGQPYLVMEFIQGAPLTDAVQAQPLSQTDRLNLFLQITEAVQHAHQRLVIHRDLKPANLYLTPEGKVKLLDFGIAKLLDPNTDPQGWTRPSQRWLTPEYAAPEQLAGTGFSTATDVYPLGLILGEILLDRPIGPKDGLDGLPEELRDIIRMALRPEPERRYTNAGQLGEDVANYLHQRPIKARPESWQYLAQKFVQRNRLLVATLSLTLLALVGGIIGTTWQARRAQQALARETVEREKAEAVTDFLIGMFRRADPYRSEDTLAAKDLPLQAFLDQSIPAIRTDLEDQPEVKLKLLEVMGELYNNLSLRKQGYELSKEALAETEAQFGQQGKEYATRVHDLANAAHDLSRMAEADSLFRIALLATEAAFGTQPEHLEVVYNDYGLMFTTQRQFAKADSMYQQALQLMELNGFTSPKNRSQTLVNRSEALVRGGYPDSAYQCSQLAIQTLQTNGLTGTVFMSHAQKSIAEVLLNLDSLDQALYWFEEAQQGFETQMGYTSHFVSLCLHMRGMIHAKREEYPQQIEVVRASLSILEELYGTEHINYAVGCATLGKALGKVGKTAEARKQLKIALEQFQRWDIQPNVKAVEGFLADLPEEN
ncbi:MAG: serine/threonine-protein kinase [Bacteroidota bacterium]